MSTDPRDQLQSTLGSAYTLERELGGGGMSRVFVAEESALRRKVVVKLLPPELTAGVNVDRFKREILVAAQLQHPHIVPVLAAGESHGLPYYTMPFVAGESLRARLSRGGALAVTEAIGVLRDVAKALAYAHENGVVHRDIKPDNVLLSGGSATVTDFGIAKAISAARTDAPGGTLTQVGTSIGTPTYMAPEQAAGDPSTDHRADIYSFGCMAYELLTGQPPFHGKTPQRLLAAHMGETPQPVGELRPDCPPVLADLVMRCLTKDADDRPQAAAELARVLESVTSGGTQPAMPEILLGGRGMLRKALVLYALAFGVVAIVAKAAIVAIGLPDWVFPGALIVMALGLPVILVTAYVHRVSHRALFATPTLTPGGRAVPQGTMATMALKAAPHVSWRRTTVGGVYALVAFVLLVGGFMVMRALGIGPAGSLMASGKLKQNEPLLVADFAVKGGADSSLGGVVAEAVRTDLGQSRVLAVTPASTIRAALQRMQRPAGSRLDAALARELAQREGIKAVVEGDLTPLGGGYIVTVRLVSAEKGDELASFRQTADAPRDLVPTVEKLTRELRGRVGESLKQVRASPALAEVSTASLEALRKYSEGSRALDFDADYERAISLLNEAVALDSTFASAWRKLAVANANAGMPRERSDTAATRAFRYRDRLTEQERYGAIAYYYMSGPGRDRGKAAAAYEAGAKSGLVVPGAQNLGNIYRDRREFARAESVYRSRIATGGAGIVTYGNLAPVLYAQGKRAEAESVVAEIPKLFPNAPAGSEEAYFLDNRGQLDSARLLLEQLRSDKNPLARMNALFILSTLELKRGRLAESARLVAAGIDANVARGVPRDEFGDSLGAAWRDIWFREQRARGLRTIEAALVRTPLTSKPLEQRNYFDVAGLFALAGRPDRARAVLAQYDAEVRDTSLRRVQGPGRHNVQASIALAENRPLDAVKEFRASDAMPDGPVSACQICLYGSLGRAFDQANMPDSAIVMFERYLETPDLYRMELDANLAAGIFKRLGELYEAKGDKQKAASNYAQFIDLWKNADPELQPKIAEVREKLARLQRAERR